MTHEPVLENNHLRVSFGDDGSLRSLLNKHSNRQYIQHPAHGHLVRLLLPLDDWDAHHLDNSGQPAQVRTWRENGNPCLAFAWDELASSRGTFAISLECTVRLDGPQLTFGISIKNDSPHTLTELWYPWLGGLRSLSDDPQETHLLVPGFFHGQHLQAPYGQLDSSNGWLTNAPGGGRKLWLYPRHMQWIDFHNADEGLYFALHDNTLRAKGFLLQRDNHAAPAFDMTWVRYPYLEPGQTLEAHDYILTVHDGDWHQGADIYRDWLATWMQPRKVAPAIRKSIGWHFAFLKLGDGTPVRSYADLPALYEDARAAGLTTLQVFGFHEAGMDRGYPDYAPIAAYGGADALKEAIQIIKAQGGRVALYQAGSAANLFCGDYRPDIEQWAVRSGRDEVFRLDWNWHVYDTNGWRRSEPFVLMCYGSDWRRLLVETSQKFVGDYGATAVHFDHIGDYEFYLCHADHHRHDQPDAAPAEISDIYRDIREGIQRIDPEATIHTEGLSEVSAPWVDIHWGQNSLLGLPDVIRYTLPDLLYTTLVQENDYQQAARAFVYGILFDICIELGTGSIADYPDFSAYIAQLARLRQQLAPFLAYGTFKDNVGLRSEDDILAKIYRSPAGFGIPVLNLADDERQYRLDLDTALLNIDPDSLARVYALDGTPTDTSLSDVNLTLAPGELCVVTIPKA